MDAVGAREELSLIDREKEGTINEGRKSLINKITQTS